MTVISIVNQKGGVGKTTSAINLASTLAEADRNVLLIDLDPQGNATTSLGFNRREVFVSTYELLIEGISASTAIFPTIQPGLFIIPANENLPGAEVELANRDNRAHILKHALYNINSRFDYILIDCPPSLGILTLNGLVASDGLLIPMQAEFLALEGLTQLLKTVDIVREQLNPTLGITGVLFTMYDGRTRLTREVESEVRNFFDGRSTVFNTVIPRTVRLAEAPSHGLPITMYDPNGGSSEAYRNLASEVINVCEVKETGTGEGAPGPDPGVEEIPAGTDGDGEVSPGGDMGDRDRDIIDTPESPATPPIV